VRTVEEAARRATLESTMTVEDMRRTLRDIRDLNNFDSEICPGRFDDT
jgi:hypothetical protein